MRALFVLLALASTVAAAKDLSLHFIDVEGGQATLIVTPEGQSLLVDAGWPRAEGRDAERIVAAAKKAGIEKIDYLVVTHHHTDHVGGVEQLAERFPVMTFVDHGDNTETGRGAEQLNAAYARALAKGKRMTVKPGDKLPLKGVEVTVVTARGERITSPLKRAGQANPYCSAAPQKAADPSENARSVGIVVDYGNFRFVDLGDLTWNKEIDLVCPNNLLGPVDVYLTTHHGSDQSGPAAIVHALAARVAIMNNGARKGASPSAWQIVRSSPGLEDLWQLHFATAGGKENNTGELLIANLEEKCEGRGIVVTAKDNGEFTVTNEGSGHSKTYPRRRR
jgi:beta-lactamase superfamily II metal-dependent hydrolase